MDQETVSAVDTYIETLFGTNDPILESALKASDDEGLPEIQISPSQGKFLYMLAKLAGAKRILEVGTLGGYSSIWLARALPEGGMLVSLEFDPKHAHVARRNIAHANLDDRVEVLTGAALDTLPSLQGQEPFDLVFIDADKNNYPGYLDWALRLTRPGSLILGDNVVREGSVLDPDSDDPNVVGVRRFNEMLAADKRLEAIILQQVGTKGYDGHSLARVR